MYPQRILWHRKQKLNSLTFSLKYLVDRGRGGAVNCCLEIHNFFSNKLIKKNKYRGCTFVSLLKRKLLYIILKKSFCFQQNVKHLIIVYSYVSNRKGFRESTNSNSYFRFPFVSFALFTRGVSLFLFRSQTRSSSAV